MFSARPRDYRFATPTNVLYGSPRAAGPERQLFPGLIPLFLALVGLLLVRPTIPNNRVFHRSDRGLRTLTRRIQPPHPFLCEHLDVFQGLRAPASPRYLSCSSSASPQPPGSLRSHHRSA
jgi:hypothetical protein